MSLLHSGSTASDSKLYPEDVFSTYLYTGNSSTQAIVNGIDLAGKGGMVWIKARDDSASHAISSTLRGVGKFLESSSVNQEATDAQAITSFNSNGFSVGTNAQVNGTWGTNDLFVSWTFRKAPKFFDMVTYTGNGVSGRFINHSLTILPGLMFIKRTDTTSNWVVMSNALSYSMWLNSTNADVSSNNVNGYIPDFTASSFQVNAGSTSINAVNASGGTYVAYLFAHDTTADGIIQCGSYVGDGTTNSTKKITLGWEPQFILIRSASQVRNWSIFDVARGLVVGSGNDCDLYPNLPNAEDTGTGQQIAPVADGFVIENATYNFNTAGQTYIYMAIRRPNKPPTSGTQVFSPVAYTGNSGAQIATTNFAVDMSFARSRLTVANWDLADRLRGSKTALVTNTTQAETANGTAMSFDSNVGVVLSSGQPNVSGDNDILNGFKRAPGFFDVVCYTGTGGYYPRAIAHNLTVVPELIIVKQRNSTGNWVAASTKLLNPNYPTAPWVNNLYLNTSAAIDLSGWFDGLTASNFSTYLNTSGATYVAYLFATCPGVSKVGSYTGNGSNQTINCGFTTGARFVLIKRTDSSGDWYVWDSARGIVSANDPHLSLNTASGEITTDDSVDPDSSGFIVNQNLATNINVLNGTYIFLSIS